MDEESKVPTPRELLKDKADLLGIVYRPNITDDKLRALIAAKVSPSVPETVDKSAEEKVAFAAANARIGMMAPKRVIVTAMDPDMKDYTSTPFYSISNSLLSLPKVSVPLGVEWTIPTAYYNMLKGMKVAIPAQGKDVKGRKITTRREINKYAITDLDLLTAEEIESLKQAQIMRDGI